MKHIAIFSNSGDVQTALNEETLINPYVALVSGAVDFNELTPAYKGVWSHEYVTESGLTVYTFTLNDTDLYNWIPGYKIATVPGAYFHGVQGDVDVVLEGDDMYGWKAIFTMLDESGEDDILLYDGTAPHPTTTRDVTLNPLDDSVVAYIKLIFDGTKVQFWSSEAICDLVMNTINPVDE